MAAPKPVGEHTERRRHRRWVSGYALTSSTGGNLVAIFQYVIILL
jgi:hypothetical protein